MIGTVIRPAGPSSFICNTAPFQDSRIPFSSAPSSLRMKSAKSNSIRASVAEAPPAAIETQRKPANFYEVLRVNRNASLSEIKSAYRNLAKIYHPDVAAAAKHHPEESFDGCDFIEIRKAYSTLSDPSSREVYDLKLRMGGVGGRRSPAIQSNGGSGFYTTTRRWETDQCW